MLEKWRSADVGCILPASFFDLILTLLLDQFFGDRSSLGGGSHAKLIGKAAPFARSLVQEARELVSTHLIRLCLYLAQHINFRTGSKLKRIRFIYLYVNGPSITLQKSLPQSYPSVTGGLFQSERFLWYR